MCKHPVPKHKLQSTKSSKRIPTVDQTTAKRSSTFDQTNFEVVDAKTQTVETSVEQTQDECSGAAGTGASIPEAKKSRFHVLAKLLPKSKENKSKESTARPMKGSAETLKTAAGKTPITPVKNPSAEIVSHTVTTKGAGVAKPEVRGNSQVHPLPEEEKEKKPVVAFANRKITAKKSRHDPQYQTLYDVNKEWESDVDGFSAYANVVETTQVSTAKLSGETDKTQATTVTTSAEPVH